MRLPDAGKLFWFQRLLVIDAAPRIEVTYLEPRPVAVEVEKSLVGYLWNRVVRAGGAPATL